ncbi:hypothetical protein QWZ08_07280 [Ferruginibacter paludis]|uniref:hypothetical protein n=1 Tax=Ferruginibacter paludis TaxID=1310417 RepID=UPI0025B46C6E|nr:hypothetical protein [Ferruginibacter paludis]MDN3655420.1 hypothetical protein [Ferruginibacter paludis]
MDKLQQHYIAHQAIYRVCCVFIILVGMGGFYENKMPVVGFFWAGFVATVYWLIKTGKFKTFATRGCVIGVLIDFFLLYTLHKIHPEEDIAGIVIISLLLSGFLFALTGYLIQHVFWKKKMA